MLLQQTHSNNIVSYIFTISLQLRVRINERYVILVPLNCYILPEELVGLFQIHLRIPYILKTFNF
jgi:hypothetical protein